MTARLTVGDPAPALDLADADGRRLSLDDRRGQRVVVYFYPRAATPGCTTEACDFRDSLASLAAGGYAVVGVSPDGADEIRAFADAEGITFPLLSDPDARVARAWGAWGRKTVGDREVEGVLRSTFVIGDDGVVTRAEYAVDAEGHVARLRRALGIEG